jgi:DNA-binding transcriptional MocR family regulator
MAALAEAAAEALADLLDVTHAVSGMRTVAWIRTGARDKTVVRRARARGLELAALSDFTLRHRHPDGLILGFAGCSGAELRRGAGVLAGVMNDL